MVETRIAKNVADQSIIRAAVVSKGIVKHQSISSFNHKTTYQYDYDSDDSKSSSSSEDGCIDDIDGSDQDEMNLIYH
eukprot:12868280-Ditylum_brightwellii.AAC.1